MCPNYFVRKHSNCEERSGSSWQPEQKKDKTSITDDCDDDKPIVGIGKSEVKAIFSIENKFDSTLLNLRLRTNILSPSVEQSQLWLQRSKNMKWRPES